MIKTLLVEDHELTRLGLSMILSKEAEIELIGEADNGLKGVELAKRLNPDVIVMDIGLPQVDGIEATRRIKAYNPDCKILIFTSKDSEDDIFDAFKSGADGYVMKDTSSEQFCTAIKSVYQGVALTEREMEVLSLIVEGLTNSQIAENLTITTYTAKAHVHSVLQKLSAGTRAKATQKAITEGLV